MTYTHMSLRAPQGRSNLLNQKIVSSQWRAPRYDPREGVILSAVKRKGIFPKVFEMIHMSLRAPQGRSNLLNQTIASSQWRAPRNDTREGVILSAVRREESLWYIKYSASSQGFLRRFSPRNDTLILILYGYTKENEKNRSLNTDSCIVSSLEYQKGWSY